MEILKLINKKRLAEETGIYRDKIYEAFRFQNFTGFSSKEKASIKVALSNAVDEIDKLLEQGL